MGASSSSPTAHNAQAGGCPVIGATQADPSECPAPERYRNPAIYNVYGQRINDPHKSEEQNPLDFLKKREIINPINNMPLEANQVPWPGQREPLSTSRRVSNIPKGGTDTTWVYPSPQMFYNDMNERTWQQVQTWEKLHRHTCGNPTLLRFRGRPDDYSPLARLRSLLGAPLPFDRHDWTVDRCGEEVRYVIDFYYNEDKAGTSQAFEVVTRPALDSFESALDRVKMAIYVNCARWGLPCPITGQSAVVGTAAVQAMQQQEQTTP